MAWMARVLVFRNRPAYLFSFLAIGSAMVAWAVAVVQAASFGELRSVAGYVAEGLRGSALPFLLTI